MFSHEKQVLDSQGAIILVWKEFISQLFPWLFICYMQIEL